METQTNIHQQNEPNFLIEKDGKKVLREIPSHLLFDEQQIREITTPEGFIMRGHNDSSFIKSLHSLNGIDIKSIEFSMRFGVRDGIASFFEGSDDKNFIKNDEFLLDLMVGWNDIVLKNNLTHRQLGEFLAYFDDALIYLKSNNFKDKPDAFEFNNHTFICSVNNDVSGKRTSFFSYSPFSDSVSLYNDEITITCLENGSQVQVRKLAIPLIYRWGFYRNKGVQEVHPIDIAKTAGLVSFPEDDPVTQLVKDKNASLMIKTEEEVKRMYNLNRVGINLFKGSNYTIVPENITVLESLYEMSEANFLQEVKEHITIPQTLNPIDYKLKDQYLMLDDSFFTQFIPSYFSSEIRQIILSGIKTINFVKDEDGSSLTRSLIILCVQQPVHADYFTALVRKIIFSPNDKLLRNMKELVFQLTADTDRKDENKVNSLIETIDSIMPSFKEKFLTWYKELGIITNDVPLSDLIKYDFSFNCKELDTAIEYFCSNVYNLTITRSDMSEAFRVIAKMCFDRSYQCSAKEKKLLKKLKIDQSRLSPSVNLSNSISANTIISLIQYQTKVARQTKKYIEDEDTHITRIKTERKPDDKRIRGKNNL